MPTWIDEKLAIAPMPSEDQISELLRHSKRLSFSWRTRNWITIYTSGENLE